MPVDDLAGGIPGPTDTPLANALGMAAWGLRVAPEMLTGTLRLLANPPRVYRRLRRHSRTAGVYGAAFAELVPGPKGVTPPSLGSVREVVCDGSRAKVASGVPYGPAPGMTLDIWRSPGLDPSSSPSAPVVVYIPGGGWVVGTTMVQGHVLLSHLASKGFVCVSVGYRVSPRFRWPTHLYDVKRALAWVHEHIAEHGGDPDRIAIAGASAGGHLAAIAGLTMGDPSLQPGFEDERTDVTAVAGLYGRYDWESRTTVERRQFMGFLERIVVGQRQQDVPEVFRAASPMALAGPQAPPFLVVHGRSDAVIPVHQAREFVDHLRAVSTNPVVYAELPGTGHGFDIVDPFRAAQMAQAVELFLRTVEPPAHALAV